MTDDITLLREFAERRLEAAFAELVRRHLGLVHSAALRQTGGDAQMAEEVTQSVFVLLARKAAGLDAKTILPAWLYRTTRYVAADARRAGRRRAAREQEAHLQSTLLNDPADTAWQQLAPILDAAMAELGETDRAILVLRYFENQTAREIATTLRMEEAAAQKRASRALDKLRDLFAKRGVTLTASALTGAVAANAVQAAPAAMVANIAAAALAGTAATATVLIMTTLQKLAITAALTVTVGAGIYEAQQAAQARAAVRTLQEQQGPLRAELGQLRRERDDARSRLGAANATEQKTAGDNFELLRLRGEVAVLRQQLAGRPAGEAPAPKRPPGGAAGGPADVAGQLAAAIERGDAAALDQLGRLAKAQAAFYRTNSAGLTGDEEGAVWSQAFGGLMAAFDSLSDEALKGNGFAREAIERASEMNELQGLAVTALGQLAAAGDAAALDKLVHPDRYGLLLSSTVGALQPAADKGNPQAIAVLASVLEDDQQKALWRLAALGLQKAAATGNTVAAAALQRRAQAP